MMKLDFAAASLLLSLSMMCHGFQVVKPPAPILSFANERIASPSRMVLVLQAKKNSRRRRKETTSTTGGTFSNVAGSSSADEDDDEDDLPDFDLDITEEAPASSNKRQVQVSSPDAIIDVMMGTSNKPLMSVKELINDRSLESMFKFDEPSDPSLPDLPDLAAIPAGKKRVRAQSRKEAAMARENDNDGPDLVETASNLLEKIPFVSSDRETAPLKLVENITWLGIFLLIAWEIYINSPFFDRSAPLAPIVYELLP